MYLLPCVFLALAVSCSVPARPYTVYTVAGGGLPVNIPGSSASLENVSSVAVDYPAPAYPFALEFKPYRSHGDGLEARRRQPPCILM